MLLSFGRWRSALVYSTTAKSYSWRVSASCPRRIALVAALQPPAMRVSATSAARRRPRSGAGRGRNDIHTTRNLEREGLIGHTGVFLQIREGEARRAPLGVDRDQTADAERCRVDHEHERIVLRLPDFGY